MNMNQLRQEEHQKYFFGVCSSEVYCTLEESIKRCVDDFTEQIEEALIEENVSSKLAIAKEVAEVKAFYMSRCMEVLVDFKKILQNILEIPDNASIYPKSKKKTYTEDEISLLREKVAHLYQKFFREKMFLDKLKREKAVLDKLRPLYVDTKIILERLKNETSSNSIDKLIEIHQNHVKSSDHHFEIDRYPELGSDLGIY